MTDSAAADARTLREMADEMSSYAYYETLHQIANRLSPSTATSLDEESGVYAYAAAATPLPARPA